MGRDRKSATFTDSQLSKEFNNIKFYGHGPGENYWDRKAGSFVGLYTQTIDEQYFPLKLKGLRKRLLV